MEEFINSINRACELARTLEADLPNLANEPDMLSIALSIDQVVKAFSAAKDRLSAILISQQVQTTAPSFAPALPHEAFKQEAPQPPHEMGSNPTLEWLGSSYAQATMDQLLQLQAAMRSTTPFDVRALLESKMMAGGVDFSGGTPGLQIGEMGGRDVEGSERSKGSEGEVQAKEASSSRPRKRKNDLDKIKMICPAPMFGNTEIPPEDGFTWRKYGQKEILGSNYPRSYYRCTHQKLYKCPAKKQVQRLDHNPSLFQVTYRGEHTCHKSSTAPSPAPPPQLLVDMTLSASSPQLSPSSTSVSGWLPSVKHSLQGGGGAAPAGAAASSGGAGPSNSRFGTDYLVADMADAMFNSGSSSVNSMESLFAPAEDKWKPNEKKKS